MAKVAPSSLSLSRTLSISSLSLALSSLSPCFCHLLIQRVTTTADPIRDGEDGSLLSLSLSLTFISLSIALSSLSPSLSIAISSLSPCFCHLLSQQVTRTADPIRDGEGGSLLSLFTLSIFPSLSLSIALSSRSPSLPLYVT